MGAAVETKPTTTLAGYLDLEDRQIRSSFPICRCSRNSAPHFSAVSSTPKRTLSRTARALLFGTLLMKRVRERWHEEICDDVGVGVLYKEINREKQLVCLYSGSTSHHHHHQSLPNSISSSESESESIILNENSTSGSRIRSWYAYKSGFGFVLVSLGVTVMMQGRVIAILISLMWLYFYAWIQSPTL